MYAISMRATVDGDSVGGPRVRCASARTRGRYRTVAGRSHRLFPALAALLVVAAVGIAMVSVASRPEAPRAGSWATISVGPNTTLWGLACAHPISGLGTSGTIDAIRAENALVSSVIHVGQTIRVPAPATDTAVYARR